VIIGMHHEQDIRKMGGLKKYMPITYWTSLIGSLALIGFPGLAGFFSKDSIIEAVHLSTTPGAGFAYVAVLSGVFITALYSFRLFFLVFHGEERFDDHTREHLHESPKVVTVPLILLAIPSVIAGYVIGPVLFGDYFGGAIVVNETHNVLGKLGEEYHGVLGFIQHGIGIHGYAFWLSMAGLFTAWYIYIKKPVIAQMAKDRLSLLYKIMDHKYWMDDLYIKVFARLGRLLGLGLWKGGDVAVIDGMIINGSANAVGWLSGIVRQVQTGYLYHYAFAMILGLLGLLSWVLFGSGR
jgi:NADH-quinone oxidoreductase subunit L